MALLVLLLAMIPLYLLSGFVISTLWGWFIVTAFPGAPDLGVAAAIGVSLVVSAFFTGRGNGDDEPLELVVRVVLLDLMLLGMGWVVHQFVGGA